MLKLPPPPGPVKSYDLYEDPVIARVNAFDDESAGSFREKVRDANETGQPILPVVVSSYGGNLDACVQMHGAIRQSDIPVLTYTPDRAYSCGFALMAFGTPGYRFIDPNAFTMVHQVSYGAIGKEAEIENKVEFQERQNEAFYGLLDEACDKDEGFFSDFFGDKNNLDQFLDADETVDLGAADSIGRPKLRAEISFDWALERNSFHG
jgi:ATP-dependent protease ClpP protease subunit